MLISVRAISEAELNLAIVRNPLVVNVGTTVMEAIARMSGVRSVCSVDQTTGSQYG
ncbi:CBS domain-containing protein [Dolichospermum compactum]|uniref:Multi-sensor hybrid histidine kinase n=1 Tax=Dolichospermum compactum NIES-806 TaxID=1973481 RepID=A0A1Z4V6A8_9CYAN|nr:hypothetical protein [Dolichospermum compactum]BAZ86978.1 multi-sensor hybrid histidine kinase [Dolichospermum compactum NIES-806]